MLASLFVHTGVVETFTGATPTGDGYAAPITVKGLLDDGLVRVQSASGEQLVQKSVWYCLLTFSYNGTTYNASDVFKPESRFTANGRASQVTQVRRREAGPMFAGVAHLEVELT